MINGRTPTHGASSLQALLLTCALACASCGGSSGSDSAPSWDGSFPTPVARPEHPRPDFRRDSFVNLNTVWDFAYDAQDLGLEERWFESDDTSIWTEQIQVPYAWEAPLSGLVPTSDGRYSPIATVAARSYRGVAWYRLELPGPPPEQAGLDWHLVFGAVDFAATVWVDGVEAGHHEGGYDPFSVNLSRHARSRDRAPVIVLRVEDGTELANRAQPVGKQGGIWYTRTSGIWQTVYLELRPELYVEELRIVPDPQQARVHIRLELTGSLGPATVRARAFLESSPETTVGTITVDTRETSVVEFAVPLDAVLLWQPETPVLYGLTLEVETPGTKIDRLHSYFGLVTVTTDWLPGHSPADTATSIEQYQALQVNDRPRYLRCVLDQSYWPEGVYTAPSLEAIRADLELARDLGFNCVRVHIKSDEPVKYRLLDEMGFLVIYDIVSLDMQARNGAGFEGRALFEQTMRRTMARDASHPSIVGWVVFNENWGLSANGSLLFPRPLGNDPELQGWVREMVDLAREIDPTRPVEDNSAGGIVGVFEHLTTDLNSFHHYPPIELNVNPDSHELARGFRAFLLEQERVTFPGSTANFVGGATQDGAPWFNSEFASFSFVGATSERKFCDLFILLNEMRRTPKLVGWVLTQLTDVEYELNGMVRYDRSPYEAMCSRDGVGIADVFGDDFVAFDWLPEISVEAGSRVTVPLRYSHWSSGDAARRRVTLRWAGRAASSEAEINALPYGIVAIENLVLDVPTTAGPTALIAEVLDATGHRVAANRLEARIE